MGHDLDCNNGNSNLQQICNLCHDSTSASLISIPIIIKLILFLQSKGRDIGNCVMRSRYYYCLKLFHVNTLTILEYNLVTYVDIYLFIVLFHFYLRKCKQICLLHPNYVTNYLILIRDVIYIYG